MHRADIFLIFCLCLTAGVFLGTFVRLTPLWGFLFLVLLCFSVLFSVLFKNRKLFIPFLFLFSVLVGVWRMNGARKRIQRPDLDILYGRKVEVEAWVCEQPVDRVFNKRAVVCVPELRTRILVKDDLFPEVGYGQWVRVSGRMEEPASFSGFDYKGYLKRKGIHFVSSYPEVRIISGKRRVTWKTLPLRIKKEMEKGLEKVCSFPEAGFFEALLFGDENNIPPSWKEKLNRSGTRHIAAVSGMNVTILSSILLNLLLFLGLWRKQAFWISLILIGFYVVMIGAPSCGVRAGVMGGLFLLASHSGRIPDPERLAVFTLALMLALDPLLVLDIGFQLSFLAFLGLVYLSPAFSRFFKKIPQFLGLRANLSSTLAAQVFTLPVLLYNFGQISLVAPLANILILPLIPVLTIAGFLFSFLALFSPSLGMASSLPAQILLKWVMEVISFFSSFSWATRQVRVSEVFVFSAYLLIGLGICWMRRKEKLSFLG